MNDESAGYSAARFDTRWVHPERRVRRYVTRGYRQVQGWLSGLAALEISRLDQIQRMLGISGPVCEIGVHHGRALVLLHLLTRPGELTVGIDLYDTLDAWDGRERRARLIANLRSHDADLDRVRIVCEDSQNLTPDRILEQCAGPPRLFLIDGGRTADITCNDLGLALGTVCKGGLVLVDDYFQESWPGVSEGVCRFMTQSRGFHPIAIGGNKLIFTKSWECIRAYKEGLASMFEGQVRKSIMFGEPVLMIGSLTFRSRIARTRTWKAIRSRAVGRMLRALVRTRVGGNLR
jgi:hypothetical protein